MSTSTAMRRTRSTAVVAIAGAAVSLLAGCGGTQPESSPSAPASASAAPTAPASSPTPIAAPSSTTPSPEQTAAAKAATEKFVQTALTLGYPDKTIQDFLDRLKPLMTTKGYADAKKAFNVSDKQTKSLYDKQVRGKVTLTSAAKVDTITDTKAATEITYKLLRQQRVNGKWKTLTTGENDTVKLSLVKAGNKWLVDTAT